MAGVLAAAGGLPGCHGVMVGDQSGQEESSASLSPPTSGRLDHDRCCLRCLYDVCWQVCVYLFYVHSHCLMFCRFSSTMANLDNIEVVNETFVLVIDMIYSHWAHGNVNWN